MRSVMGIGSEPPQVVTSPEAGVKVAADFVAGDLNFPDSLEQQMYGAAGEKRFGKKRAKAAARVNFARLNDAKRRAYEVLDGNEKPLLPPAVFHGEYGDHQWIARQLDHLQAYLATVPGAKIWKKNGIGEGKYTRTPLFTVPRGTSLDPEKIKLFYFERAEAAWEPFEAACKKHGLKDQRLQIGINVLDLAIFAFWKGAPRHLDAMLDAMRRELQEIQKLTHGKVFYLIEVPVATIMANFLGGVERAADWAANTLEKLSGRLENVLDQAHDSVISMTRGVLGWLEDAILKVINVVRRFGAYGIHFCYGDLAHASVGDHGKIAKLMKLYRLFKYPHMVELANELLGRLAVTNWELPELMQFPMALGSRPPSMNLEELRAFEDLLLPKGVQFFAGFIHEGRTEEELKQILFGIEKILGRQVGLSNSCGFGRMEVWAMYYCMYMTQVLAYAEDPNAQPQNA